jgi:hypothetical protein
MSLEKILNNFHNAILENDASPAIPDIKLSNRISVKQQLAIYIDGYRIRLVQAIRSDYPATLGLLGEAEFDKLALEYIENNSPSSFNLDRYPHCFAEFIKNRVDDFAAEIAILEGTIAEIFMLPESAPFNAGELAGLSPMDIANLILKPRAASKLLEFKYNVHEWLNEMREGKNQELGKLESKDFSLIPDSSILDSTFLYIYRHENEVKRAVLRQAEYAVLGQILSGLTLEKALEEAVEIHSEYEDAIAINMQEWFSKWTLSGFFAKYY